jgi:hypothetical protein
MRSREFIAEFRENRLYHATTFPSALAVWKSQEFRPGTSFTRMWTYAWGYARGMNYPQSGYVVFALDYDRLRREFGRRNLYFYDWFQVNEPVDARYSLRHWWDDTDRAEVRNVRPIPLSRFLASVDVWLPVDYRPSADPKYTLMPLPPQQQAQWEAMQRDPRVKLHEPGPPRSPGVNIRDRRQYDQDHDAYGRNSWRD